MSLVRFDGAELTQSASRADTSGTPSVGGTALPRAHSKNLGLRVVAEGVETAEHWSDLEAMGCDSAQGYYLSRPLPAGELTPWLTKQAVLPSTRLSRAAPA